MANVLYEQQNGISYIQLDRPERYNALNKEMLEELLAVIEKVENNADKIIVLSGNGNAFCAGGDIGMMTDFAEKKFFDEVMETIAAIVVKLYMMPKVVISAVQGSAAGLGLSLALTADYVVSQKDAKFGMLFLGVGLAPDGGGHFWLEQRLGTHQAKQFTWSMKQVDGLEAKQMGLVDVVSDRNVVEAATGLGEKIRSTPLVALLETKMMYHEKHRETLEYYLSKEQKTQWKLRHTKDHLEGVQAFLEKRQPKFMGE